ncbi:MAG: hypothetical protein KatS3mg096_309 [Candidatus Parcubacteria bacterium]|nr:MAG: hypothetical protein KatS3mg096_309 [Candidatus Parcubacteria bacterium]
MDRITKILVWLIVIIFFIFLFFTPINIYRQEPQKVSPIRVY